MFIVLIDIIIILRCNFCILTVITDRDKTKEDYKEYFLLGML